MIQFIKYIFLSMNIVLIVFKLPNLHSGCIFGKVTWPQSINGKILCGWSRSSLKGSNGWLNEEVWKESVKQGSTECGLRGCCYNIRQVSDHFNDPKHYYTFFGIFFHQFQYITRPSVWKSIKRAILPLNEIEFFLKKYLVKNA